LVQDLAMRLTDISSISILLRATPLPASIEKYHIIPELNEREPMSTCVSLLRGINVGPTRTVKMADLVTLYRSLGLKNVRTYLNSGNVLFDSPRNDQENLPALLEKQITRTVGFPVKVLVRTGDELDRVITSNPFLQTISRDTAKLYVTFISENPSENSVVEVNTIKYGFDRFIIRGLEIYLFCPNGYGKTKFSNSFFEKGLAVMATTRNWKTVTALSALAKG
jgi:uncharacterized protein (DUF1697 family)